MADISVKLCYIIVLNIMKLEWVLPACPTINDTILVMLCTYDLLYTGVKTKLKKSIEDTYPVRATIHRA